MPAGSSWQLVSVQPGAMSSKPTEILVHITAPSRASDDTDYRSLATAYLAFDPTERTTLDSLAYSQDRAENTPTTQEQLAISPDQDHFVSPKLSFGSAAHNLDSPDIRRARIGEAVDRNESQSSWRAPPSVVADSNPENDISIARYCSPTRILEHYLQGFDSSQSNGSQPLSPTVASSSSTSRRLERIPIPAVQSTSPAVSQPTGNLTSLSPVIPQTPTLAARESSAPAARPMTSSDADIIPSSLPSQQATSTPSDNLTRPAHETVTQAMPAVITTTPLSLSIGQVDRSSRADSEPPQPPKRQKRVHIEASSNSLARSSSDIGPRQGQVKRRQLDRRQKARQSAEGLEIHAPEPTVSCAELDISVVITEPLKKLATDLDINTRFQPRHRTRDPRPFERGHWFVDCSAWPESVRMNTWAFLTNYVGNGVAGWGIWCRRNQEFTWMRLYCWGCVVGHMHLLLYISSQRQLNYTQTTWIGGDGEAVIIMEPKYP
ncbi:hypothetical protein CONLIGDRAFT_639467 [Coniochaeta ligniaria NRRL 30616]|uniref:Uncharacterized protein n=1 Tax=Coniochaeta ligniaria NRRL 30616 TaxID=1408157 RepID=A0A1J7J721_9PEZI|nr:hypothetical protein CONLIGDRAFT_639467 [Coniochaeta ligniaria NRRL 30616]